MIIYNENEMIQLGEKIGNLLDKGDTVILKGDLACGKTTFAKGVGKALGVKQVINSPTFTILKVYDGFIPLYHIDAYRLENNDYDLGIDEYSQDGITLVEWPEYYKDYLPAEYLEVDFRYVDFFTREVELIAHGAKYERIIDKLYADTVH